VRTFVALPLPRPTEESERRSAPEHLTLRFLGDVPESVLPELERSLRAAVEREPPFEVVLEGIGAFPTPERPRVVWRAVGAGREALHHLAGAVRRAVVEVGLADDPTPFVPHVTLFRVRSSADSERAREVLAGPGPPPTRVSVREVELVESRLTSRGAVHHPRATFPLRGGSD
jgi:RNA 2',3'-cyclic 3'-phosphodiesterase